MAGPRRHSPPPSNTMSPTTSSEPPSWWDDLPNDDSDDENRSMEVTHDDFTKSLKHRKPPIIPGRRLLKSLRSPRNKQSNSPPRPSLAQDFDSSQLSVTGAFTVASNDDTVQVSNRRKVDEDGDASTQKKKPWKTLKRIISKKNSNNNNNSSLSDRGLSASLNSPEVTLMSSRERARSEGGPNALSTETTKMEVTRKRSDTEPNNSKGFSLKRFDTEPIKGMLSLKKKSSSTSIGDEALLKLQKEQSQLDHAIKGRLDGVDVLSLGTARQYHGSKPSPQNSSQLLQQPLTHSLKHSPQKMVESMLWTSGGKDQAEMVLEGFIPGGDDRWMVKMEKDGKSPKSSPKTLKKELSTPSPQSSSESSPSLSSAASSCGSALCGSSPVELSPPVTRKSFVSPFDVRMDNNDIVDKENEDETPIHVLLKSMWGDNPPPPTHNHSGRKNEDDQNDVLSLAASCSVPIDLDDDTFIIDTAAHLRAVHDILSEPIKHARYDDALEIFRKITRGLQGGDKRKRPLHLVGSTLHNMGIVQMWQGKYNDALDSLEQAVSARQLHLPKGHVDIAVSYAWQGLAHLALETYDLAISSLQQALDVCKPANATRAKLLNNLGVAHFLKQDHVEALVCFTSALEIQRKWLDNKVRRTFIVYDASITLQNMGRVYLERRSNEYDTALYVYEEALLLQTTAFPKDHDIVVSSLGNLAYVKALHGDVPKAIQIYKGVLRAQQARYGEHSKQAMETLGLIGLLHSQIGQHEESLSHLSQVYKWQQEHLSANNAALKHVKNCIQRMERSLQSEASAWI